MTAYEHRSILRASNSLKYS